MPDTGAGPMKIEALMDMSARDMWSLDDGECADLQLRTMQERFTTLREKVPQLGKLADMQNVSRINSLDDMLPLLFQHTVYKSYPVSLLEKKRYDLLTKWLDGLTAHDLSKVDVSGCKSIDGWFDALEAQTPLRPNHSTGTSGKVSVVPRDVEDLRRFNVLLGRNADPMDGGKNPVRALMDGNDRVPVIFPTSRYGRLAPQRMLAGMLEIFGDAAELYPLRDDFMSCDVALLAGRVRAAEQKGTLDQLEIDPELLRKFKATMGSPTKAQDEQAAFFDRVVAHCKGRRVYALGAVPMMYNWMLMGEARGITSLFAPGSVIQSGGGTKGAKVAPDWQERVERFLGNPVQQGYGMSEQTTSTLLCEHGHYHPLPFTVPFLLDPKTGQGLPRSGKQTGRLAFFDLLCQSYWGGFVTGDKVTVGWDGCPCGRKGPYYENKVERFSELEGGDDKISCAGSADAHAAAMDYLIARAEQL